MGSVFTGASMLGCAFAVFRRDLLTKINTSVMEFPRVPFSVVADFLHSAHVLRLQSTRKMRQEPLCSRAQCQPGPTLYCQHVITIDQLKGQS